MFAQLPHTYYHGAIRTHFSRHALYSDSTYYRFVGDFSGIQLFGNHAHNLFKNEAKVKVSNKE